MPEGAICVYLSYLSCLSYICQDVDLKDEIPEGEEEEEVEFSGSDDTYSDDSFTDEDDIQFEQEQAKMLGLSPTKEVCGDVYYYLHFIHLWPSIWK